MTLSVKHAARITEPREHSVAQSGAPAADLKSLQPKKSNWAVTNLADASKY
jgi:hypothetical protein